MNEANDRAYDRAPIKDLSKMETPVDTTVETAGGHRKRVFSK